MLDALDSKISTLGEVEVFSSMQVDDDEDILWLEDGSGLDAMVPSRGRLSSSPGTEGVVERALEFRWVNEKGRHRKSTPR